MLTPKLRLRRPTDPNPFQWSAFIASLLFSAFLMFLFGLVMDNSLRIFGVGISAWIDAMWDSSMAAIFGFLVAPIFWRIGLVTFPQYLLGAFALMVPITILSVLILSRFHDVGVEVAGIDTESFPNQYFAITAYVRLIRAMIFVPFFLAAFYWWFHVAFGMAPKQTPVDSSRR